MNNYIKFLAIVVMAFFLSVGADAQDPPPPNGGSGAGSGNTPVGGGAPIGGGLLILTGLVAAYGGSKVLFGKKTNDTKIQ